MTQIDTNRPAILEPIQLGSILLANRVMVPAHEPRLAEPSGPTDEYIAYHRARARGGAAIQLTGQLYVSSAVAAEAGAGRFALVDDTPLEGLTKLAEAIHEEGGRMLAQLGHPGALATARGSADVAATDLYSDIKGRWSEELSRAALDRILRGYRKAAGLAMEAGLDGIEVSMHTGNLLAGFLSPMNTRNDSYGGSLENRVRFPLMVVEAVRSVVGPETIVGVKLSADEYLEGGLDWREGTEIAKSLAVSGRINYLSVTVGTGIRMAAQRRERRPVGMCLPHGEFRHITRSIKRVVGDLPVCYIGGVTDINLAAEIIDSGDADLVGMVRAHIADPDIVRKFAADRTLDIRPCIHTNACIDSVSSARTSIQCTGNPVLGFERMWWKLEEPSLSGRRLLVVGGGPAGMEAARVAGKLGAEVVLMERQQQLGGLMRLWGSAARLAEVNLLTEWWARQLDHHRVDVQFGASATVEDVTNRGWDHVFIATGARPTERPIEHFTSDSAVKIVDEVEAYRATGGETAIVFDRVGGGDAVYVAERLRELYREVHVVTTQLHLAKGEGLGRLYAFLERIEQLGVHVHERANVRAMGATGIEIRSNFGAVSGRLKHVDLLVNMAGRRPHPQPALGGKLLEGDSLSVIGDAHEVHEVHEGVSQAAQAVLKIAGISIP